MILGKIDEALELILDNDSLFRYSEEVLPFKMNPHPGTIAVRAYDYGRDCLTRNLYTVFNVIGYKNGVKIIDYCQRRHYIFNPCIVYDKYEENQFKSDMEKCKRYINWNNMVVFIPDFYSEKDGKYYHKRQSVIKDRYIVIEKIKRPENAMNYMKD